jgi:uncharacterized protein YciI
MTLEEEYLYRIRQSRPEMLSAGPTEEEAAVIDAHAAYLRELADRGVVRLAGRTLTTGPETFGIVILAAGSAEDARRIMDADPAVKRGVMRAELFPFRTAITGK